MLEMGYSLPPPPLCLDNVQNKAAYLFGRYALGRQGLSALVGEFAPLTVMYFKAQLLLPSVLQIDAKTFVDLLSEIYSTKEQKFKKE